VRGGFSHPIPPCQRKFQTFFRSEFWSAFPQYFRSTFGRRNAAKQPVKVRRTFIYSRVREISSEDSLFRRIFGALKGIVFPKATNSRILQFVRFLKAFASESIDIWDAL
jgi:hypothetical protein